MAEGTEIVKVVEFRSMTSLPRIESEAEAVMAEKAFAMRIPPRSNNRQFMLAKLKAETVFLDNLRIAPAPGTVKLRNEGATLFDAHLVDTILIAVQAKSTVTAKTAAFTASMISRGQGLKRMGLSDICPLFLSREMQSII
jgi:hypothetical protein